MEKININKITTETRNQETVDIDIVSTKDMLKLINEQDKKVALAVETQIENISKVVDAAVEAIKNGGRVIYFGAGTSGRLGVLDASEMLPTFGEGNWFIGLIAGGEKALITPIENAEDSKNMIIEDLKRINASEKDILIGIAASGRTPYVLSGIQYANKINAISVAITTSKDAIISKEAKIAIEAVTGPETITGSTRMKSGTAQKLILNMISTGVMVKLGKTYSNWMVDVKPTNKKLIQRAITMISKLTETSEEVSKQLFEKSGQNVKVAFLMHKKQVSKEEAIKLLKENNDLLRKII